jgi:anti-sigma regulatory factor (Ser/Thr protein kinase)
MKDISLHILDIAQNSIAAGAGMIEISIHEDLVSDRYILTVKDNGKGMDKVTLSKVSDPFFTSRTTRKVGLGIPLLKLNAERTGGSFTIESETGKGTKITAAFVLSNIDLLPEGDLTGTIVMLASMNPTIEFVYTYTTATGSYTFDTREIKNVLGEISISDLSVYPYLKEIISENLKEIKTHNNRL